MKKRRMSSLFVSLFLVTTMLVTACGNNGNSVNSTNSGKPSKNGGNTTPVVEEENKAEEIDWSTVSADIQFVYPGTSESEKLFAETFKEDMKVKYPNVNIELMYLSWQDMETKLAVMINSGKVPDITATQDVTNLVQMNGLESLNRYIEREGTTISKDSFLPGTLEYSMSGDDIYSIPGLANSFSLIVNEEMLNEVGMNIADLKTWEDVERAAALMTKDGKYGFGYPLSVARFAFRVPFTAGYSNDLLLSDTSGESKNKYIELLTHMKNLEQYQPKAHLTWGYPEMFRAYSNGEVGMIVAGTFFSANVYSINPDIIDVSRALAYPQGPSGSSAKAPVSNMGYAIFKDSKNKEVSWKLIEELVSAKYNALNAAIVNVSALKATKVDDVMVEAENIYPKAIDGHRSMLEDFQAMLDTSGVQMDKIVGQSEMETIVQEYIVKMLTEKSSVDDAYNSIKTGLDEIKTKYE